MLAKFSILLVVAPALLATWGLQGRASTPAKPSAASADAEARKPVQITLGQSVVALNGPWKFQTGDDPRWSDPSFDDSTWETLDLTPAAGAHDADVGLTGYVPGWAARGHAGYWGYAWYRMRVSVEAHAGATLALTGSADVDDAYQIFWNGALLGGSGQFSGATPVVYSTVPHIFPLAEARDSSTAIPPQSAPGTQTITGVLAFRVWMAPESAGAAPDVGGIHIAPLIGESSAIAARYQVQWLEFFRGYVVDVVEPILFAALAVMALCLFAWSADPAYAWLAAGLLLTALARANLAFASWTQVESARTFLLVENVLLIPLALGAWTIAWSSWLRIRQHRWVMRAAAALTFICVAAELCNLPAMSLFLPHAAGAAFRFTAEGARLLFAGLLALIAFWGIRQRGREGWLALLAMALISAGLFAQELNVLHVPSIWFPFGTGVSRTQFIYPVFVVVLFVLLLRRLDLLVRRERAA